jgi:hypothetical protein
LAATSEVGGSRSQTDTLEVRHRKSPTGPRWRSRKGQVQRKLTGP